MQGSRLLIALLACSALFSCSQNTAPPPPPPSPVAVAIARPATQPDQRPTLVVGLVVDQMRYDFLTRYRDDFGSDGFMRLLEDGYSCADHHFGYAPTYTGPGHASVYTGTTPAVHGIISNQWYDKVAKADQYCTKDSTVLGVGTALAAGQMSPHLLQVNTLCDQVKLATNGRGKTIGISLKDRGAILPAGRSADAAYWMVEGDWVSSTWYMDSPPEYVREYNRAGLVDDYIAGGWDLLKPEAVYDESIADNNPYESPYEGAIRPTFPYDLAQAKAANGGRDIIKATPFGNSVTLDFAKKVIEAESLGQDQHLDVLAVSCSSTDYVGHRCGPMSREVQDTYLRLDQDLAAFLSYLDAAVGKGRYVLFLTADHGAVNVPSYLQSQKMAAGYWNPGNIIDSLKSTLSERYGQGEWVANYTNNQLFLNRPLMRDRKVDLAEIEHFCADFLLHVPGVMRTYTGTQLRESSFTDGLALAVDRGWSPVRSGDVVVLTLPGYIGGTKRSGTTHGSAFAYDTHVPFVLFGNGVTAGQTFERTYIRDIAPTVAAMVEVTMPNGSTGRVVTSAFGVD